MIKCKDCVHRNDKGNCTHPKIAEDTGQFNETEKQDALIYCYSEGGGFWVGPEFGCVHGDSNPEQPKSKGR